MRFLNRKLLSCLAVLSVAHLMAQQPAAAVPTEVACLHLMMVLADGARSTPWQVRSNLLKGSGLSDAQVQTLITASDMYMASLAPLSQQAVTIHKNLKAKTVSQVQGIADLTQLDRQRDVIFETAYGKLQLRLGAASWAKFEEFLEVSIKPNIVMVQ